MTDKKFTDKEIIKALECCKTSDCGNCPHSYESFPDCEENILSTALDLINRL